jgi:5-methylcytosine-specific restriction enzyme subunit McrC
MSMPSAPVQHYAAHRPVDIQLYEWSAASPDTHQQLAGLSLGDAALTHALVRRLVDQGVVHVTELRSGLRIETGSYVGRIAIGPLNISVLPKMSWQRWIGLFSFALRLRNLVRTEPLAVRMSPSSLHDLVILELLLEARNLIGRGLHREYVRKRQNLGAPKGRIDFDRIAGRGTRDAAIPCRFTRRHDDFHLNRVLLAGLRAASTVATDVLLRSDIRHLAQQLADSVSSIPLSTLSVATAKDQLDRRTARYAPALELIELLRQGTLASIEQPEAATAVGIRGFALDMNGLWQRLLGRILREWLPDSDVKQEHALSQLIRPDPEYSPRRRGGHVPRPDFAVFQAGRLVTYLDAKYRDIWEKGLPRDMLYQLALYASAHEGRTAAILYPTEHPEASEERLCVHDPQDGSVLSRVALRPVNVAELERLIVAGMSQKVLDMRQSLARRLVFG